MNSEILQKIKDGKTALGIELGSTTIKAVLITDNFKPISTGSYLWENQLKDNIWTYELDEVWKGIQTSYKQINSDIYNKYKIHLKKINYIGVSAMMHGYLAFDKNGTLLVPFRTWRNNITKTSAERLTELFNFHIPERWSIAHLYQAILNKEPHVAKVQYLTTLAGYVTWQLTGNKNIGIGDASGMFPISSKEYTYNPTFIGKFNNLEAVQKYEWQLPDILPKVLLAGQSAGNLTQQGAAKLDITGELEAGSQVAPAEGDAGTGMVSTNSIKEDTGNISVGTSAFAMIVLNHHLNKIHKDIDIVSTPTGLPVAMVHTNNCSSDINAWVNIFKEFSELIDKPIKESDLYKKLFNNTEFGDLDAGKLVNYAYLSGENITEVEQGRPMLIRSPKSKFNLANLFKVQIYSAFASLKIGMDILKSEENIQPKSMIAQGGLFKTPRIAQQILADALNTNIEILDNADLGGPWGIAILAEYLSKSSELSLEEFLTNYVFKNIKKKELSPNPAGVKGYDQFIQNYKEMLPIERQVGNIEFM